jgi:hypothetical protein
MFEFVKSKAFIVGTVAVVILIIIITVVVAVRDSKYKAASVSSVMPNQINSDDRLKAYKMYGFAAEGCFNVSPSIFTTYIANPTTIEACAKEARSKGGQFMYITGAKDTGTLRVYYGLMQLSVWLLLIVIQHCIWVLGRSGVEIQDSCTLLLLGSWERQLK